MSERRPFVMVELGGSGPLLARCVAAYIRYRCWGSDGWVNREVSKKEISEALGMTEWEVRKALAEAAKYRLVSTTASSRPGSPRLFVEPATVDPMRYSHDPHENTSRPHENTSRPHEEYSCPHEAFSRPHEEYSPPHENTSRLRPPLEGVEVEGVEHIESASPPAADAIPAPEDPRLTTHLAIVQQQAELAKARELNRAEARKADARLRVSAEIVSAVRRAGPLWDRELERGPVAGRPTWADELADAVDELELSPAQVQAVLVAWDQDTAALGGPLLAAQSQGKGGTMPDRRSVWWPMWRPWVTKKLAGPAPRSRNYARPDPDIIGEAEDGRPIYRDTRR